MRSVPIALRVVGAATGALMLAPAAGLAYAEEGGQAKATVTPTSARPGGEVELHVTGCRGTTGTARSSAFVTDAELSSGVGPQSFLFGETTVRSGLGAGTYDISVTCNGSPLTRVGTLTVAQQGAQSRAEPTHRPDEGDKRDEGGKDDGDKRGKGNDGDKDDGGKDDGHKDDGGKDDGHKDDGHKDNGGGKDDGHKDNGGGKDDGHKDNGGKDDGGQGHEGDDEDDEDEDAGQNHDESQLPSVDPDPDDTPYAPVRAGGGGTATSLASEDAKRADQQGPGTPHTVIGLVLAGVAAVAVAFRSSRRRRVGPADTD
ncbi:hypothetical protein [Streptomyces sp. NPDC059909]|uniref:hypothetical protein n=1 Tax=Streptomyces sp. NPDC059909 TaxID=3346998 RepID=UPI0036685FD2